MNRENLALMPAYIRIIRQEMFDMKSFRHGQYETHECDSVGCVIGHCTILDLNPLPMSAFGNIDFVTWSRGFTGLLDDGWEWCFSGGWSETDNTPEGAALRIEWLLEKGVPEDWERQMEGVTLLCYK